MEVRSEESSAISTFRLGGMLLGVAVFVAFLVIPAPADLEPEAWHTAGVGLLMAIWWISEAIPIPATSLLPLVLFPLLEVGTMEQAAAPYANPLIFLFMGGFIIALAMERWDLHRRVALQVLGRVGTSQRAIIGGFMLVAAFMSMWVSNTATAVMMLPIAISVVEVSEKGGAAEGKGFAIALFLSVAYACSIGGVGTLIGTPPNAFLAGFMAESYGVEVGFAQWMMFGVPVTIVGLSVAYLVVTRFLFPVSTEKRPEQASLIKRELSDMGVLSTPEQRVGLVFLLVATLWITRPLLEGVVPGLTDAGIAIFGAVVLFLIPAGADKGVFLMDWDTAKGLPWDVLVLFGGGLSLASAIMRTGLAEWIGAALSGVEVLPIIVGILILSGVTILLTELTSNTATAAAFLPITASVAIGIGEDPFLFVLPVALAASCAFMLPVATPPNAIVYGSGRITIPQMAKAGIWLNILFTVIITVVVYLLAPVIFGVTFGELPGWLSG